MPALPLGDAGPYVAAAYLVFLALVLIYVAIMATKLARIQREIGELAALAERRSAERAEGRLEDATESTPAGAEAGAPR
jgi:energy-converting hydrogenase Eha subunit H